MDISTTKQVSSSLKVKIYLSNYRCEHGVETETEVEKGFVENPLKGVVPIVHLAAKCRGE